MILLNNAEIKQAPVSKNCFEYGNQIIWRDGEFIELITLYKLIKQLHKENTVHDDLLIIDRLAFRNMILMFIMCFIIKRSDIRVYSTIPLPESLPHNTIELVELEEDNESF
jgi:hypothetical protein